MTVAGATAAGWAGLLREAGLEDLRVLLTGDLPDQLGGEWTALTKPGLGGRQRWRWELGAGAGRRVLYVKRYGGVRLKAQLDRLLRQTIRHSSGWWEFRQSEVLATKYLPAPRAIAMAEDMRGLLERRSAVIIEAATGDAFDRAWPQLEATGAPITRGIARHDMAARIGRFVAAFHNTGYCHRDLYLCHIFVELDAAGQRPPQFQLIDLARTFRPRWRRTRWVLKDLSQLDYAAQRLGATRTERLRGLLAYLGLQIESPRVRWFVRKVTQRSGRILRREQRKGRA